ncbi:MAG: hypothetical protein HY551_05895 [Elusimicrobia bacterium]|nr:hypothetical protein [Elusimicrobiota bacterium]
MILGIDRLKMAAVAAGVWMLAGGTIASAEVVLRGIRWYVVESTERGRGQRTEVSSWKESPGLEVRVKPRAVLVVANRGPKAEEGVLLRYAVSGRVARIGDAGSEGIWTVPFWVEEKRIPVLKSNQTKEIWIEELSLRMRRHLRRLYRAGFWLKAIKIQIVAEPRQEQSFDARRILEQELPVDGFPAGG